MNLKKYYLEIISGKSKGVISFLIRGFLSLLSFFYLLIINLRKTLYKRKIFKTKKLPCYVISIGNLTWGGTGKTPLTEKVSKILSKNNIFHAILNRGYKSKSPNSVNVVSTPNEILLRPPYAGDEAMMLAEKLKGIPVITGKNRFLTGKFAIESYGVKALILDDGYQHIELERDLNILLIDASKDFRKNKLTPRGTLREPFEALVRTNLILLTKTNQIADNINYFYNFIRNYNKTAPIIKANHEVKEVIEFKSRKSFESAFFKDKKVLAFSAIADPVSFQMSLREIGAKVLDFIEFDDHHYYSIDEIKYMSKISETLKAEAIVTTEKDITRNPDLLKFMENLFFLKLSITLDEEDRFEEILLKYFERL